jgi:hypothetical protein
LVARACYSGADRARRPRGDRQRDDT